MNALTKFNMFPIPESACDLYVVEGLVVCKNGLNLEIAKSGEIERTDARRVRINLYRYQAWFPGRHEVLRYDNQHPGEEHIYHRHPFDLQTGKEQPVSYMSRENFPVMNEILDELMNLFGGEQAYIH